MNSEHEAWLERAAQFQKAKRYDEAREYALRVIRQDGRNVKALWIVASATNSLTERRNALNALLRLQPDNVPARQMLNSTNQEFKTTSELKAVRSTPTSTRTTQTSTAIRSIKPNAAPQHLLLYTTIAIAVLVIAATVVVAVTL